MMKKLALLGLCTSIASSLSINIGAKVGADVGGIWDRSENFTHLDTDSNYIYFSHKTLSQKKVFNARAPLFWFYNGC